MTDRKLLELETELLAANAALEAEIVRLREALTVCVCAMQEYQAGIGITEMFDKGELLGRKVLSAPFTPTTLQADNATAWAQAHRLALELECLLLDTKDTAIVSKWWDSGMKALGEYHELKPGAAEGAEAWAKMRKAAL